MIKGIIFDFDGTIIDTESVVFTGWDTVYREYNQVVPHELLRSIVGTSDVTFRPAEYLIQKAGLSIDPGIIYNHESEIEAAILENTPPLPGVIDYLQTAQQLGIKLAIASSSSRDWVMTHLNRMKLDRYFEAIATKEEVQLTKPYPYLYEVALKKLGLFPYQVIAIEDSPFGITSAKAAGIFTVAIPNEITKVMKMDHADMTLTSLAEISLQELIQRITSI